MRSSTFAFMSPRGKVSDPMCHRESQSGAATQSLWIVSSPLASRNDGLCKAPLCMGVGEKSLLF
ncbi:hypothetical protein MNBD_NITROSPINAE05-181 [hydrothermal vent metagenome]|uniref:Uncharacterized protein n=1 Tax=hydrothermal vent metagenome TaxID=652676 RepID=A0A3B1CFH9_9ZZZZ